ncbi:MAG: hypothetical protein ICV60_05660 [Pyrinomonadaceae bacterium]|nr:hypothetical protein [Pyrinomonadaceae bacterium]
MKKKETAVERGKEIVAVKASEKLASVQLTEEAAEGLKLLGAVQAGLNIGKSVSARSIRVLQSFLDAEGYKVLGHDSLKDFLDNSPHSPMSKNQYYDRLEILKREGDATFDLLNQMRIPVAARKQIGNGNIKIEGDKIIIGEEEIPVSDTKRVKAVVQELVNEVATNKHTIERGESEVKKYKKKLDDAKRSGATAGSPFDLALLTLLGAFNQLITEVETLSDEEREEKLQIALPQIANQRLRLEEAFGFNGRSNGNHKFPVTGETIDEIGDEM